MEDLFRWVRERWQRLGIGTRSSLTRSHRVLRTSGEEVPPRTVPRERGLQVTICLGLSDFVRRIAESLVDRRAGDRFLRLNVEHTEVNANRGRKV